VPQKWVPAGKAEKAQHMGSNPISSTVAVEKYSGQHSVPYIVLGETVAYAEKQNDVKSTF
jgi:hypothetical protein